MNRYPYAAGVLLLGVAWLSISVGDALAQKMYRWTDKNGKVHYSNIAPEADTREESSTVPIVREAPEPAIVPVPPAAELAAKPPEASSGSGRYAELSEQDFSNEVTAIRLRLKRELQQAKEQSRDIGEKLEAIKKERDRPTRVGLEILQKAYGPDKHEASEEEALRAQKQGVDQRIEEIRTQYAELREEAVKRHGRQPPWWVPIE
ncbi:MAG: DUF4124 domain-containing protein [Candidatus Binatia bacterium]